MPTLRPNPDILPTLILVAIGLAIAVVVWLVGEGVTMAA